MQVVLCSWKVAGLEQVWESPIFLPYWCEMVLEWSTMACTLRPHLEILHSLTVYDVCTCYAWLELAMWRVCGQQSKLVTFGGVQYSPLMVGMT